MYRKIIGATIGKMQDYVSAMVFGIIPSAPVLLCDKKRRTRDSFFVGEIHQIENQVTSVLHFGM